jgi:hypothetical protein
MDTVKLRDALGEVTKGLYDISGEFEALAARKQQLEAAVASLNALLSAGEQDVPLSSLPAAFPASEQTYSSEIPTRTDAEPLWATARKLLEEAGRALTVPEMAQTLSGRGHKIHSDGLRVAMIRKTDVFIKPAYGKYGLKAWEEAYRAKAQEEALDYHRENTLDDTRVA